MAEEKQQKKKLAKIKRTLRLIGLILLALLLITAFIFQAPWKVTTLITIILIACTILPKPYLKWFWLSAAIVIIALIIWVFFPEDNEGWRPYTFDEELVALEAKYAIPDEENAAIIYNRLLKNYDSNTFEPNFLDPNLEYLTRYEPWSGRDYPELAQWIKQHEDTIAKLTEASKIEKCRFPIVTDMMALNEYMKILAPMRHWAFLLSRAANNDLGENRIDQAIEKNLIILQMGKHLCQQTTMIDMWVGISIEALATEQFNRFVVTGDVTEASLSVIEQALFDIKHDWSSDFPRFLEGEKLLVKNLWGMYYAINPEGEVRRSPNPMLMIRSQCREELPQLTYWQRKLAKVSILLEWFFLPASPQKISKIIDESYEKNYPMAKPNFDWEKEPEESSPMLRFNYRYWVESMTSMTFSSYCLIHDLYLRTIAQQRGSLLIIALRRYKNDNNRWPESLNEIKSLAPAEIFIDPINGGSFIYKLTDENFTLYSRGKNNINEGGKRDRCDEEKTGADDWLIWPTKRCKSQKEKTNDEQQ